MGYLDLTEPNPKPEIRKPVVVEAPFELKLKSDEELTAAAADEELTTAAVDESALGNKDDGNDKSPSDMIKEPAPSNDVDDLESFEQVVQSSGDYEDAFEDYVDYEDVRFTPTSTETPQTSEEPAIELEEDKDAHHYS